MFAETATESTRLDDSAYIVTDVSSNTTGLSNWICHFFPAGMIHKGVEEEPCSNTQATVTSSPAV